MKRLNQQRFVLGLVTLVGLLAIGIGIFVLLGLKIAVDAITVALIMAIINALSSGKAAAFGWFYDGAADKPPPEPGTSTTTSAAVVPPAKPTPAGTPDDPLATHEVPLPTAVKGTP